jgi:hypothetical protein
MNFCCWGTAENMGGRYGNGRHPWQVTSDATERYISWVVNCKNFPKAPNRSLAGKTALVPCSRPMVTFVEMGFSGSVIRGELIELLRRIFMPVRRGNRNLVTAILSQFGGLL